MAKIKAVNSGERTHYMFSCPACNEHHSFNDTWSFNGDCNKPTVSPSLLVTRKNSDFRCHSFIKDGNIQFLDDCHHDKAGQTLKIPEWN